MLVGISRSHGRYQISIDCRYIDRFTIHSARDEPSKQVIHEDIYYTENLTSLLAFNEVDISDNKMITKYVNSGKLNYKFFSGI